MKPATTDRIHKSTGLMLAISCFFLFPLTAGFASELRVSGWPTPDFGGERPLYDFGDEPVVGRQMCPPLTRLNVRKKVSEGIVLRRAVEEFRNQAGSLWRLELRSGIFWWNGEALTAEHVSKMLKAEFSNYVKDTFQGVFAVPDFEISASDSQTVTIDWKRAPPFGPYVFNGMPVFRAATTPGATQYECVGNYRPTTLSPLELTPAPGYSFSSKLPTLKFVNDPSTADLRFEFSGDPAASNLNSCSAVWPSPYFSVISWNLTNGRAANPGFRKLMSGLIPRKQIVSSGVLAYSLVVCGPSSCLHPGFNANAGDMSFDANQVSTSLNAMGLRRKKSDTVRTDSKGKPVRLVLVNSRKDEGLIEKLISDSFSSVGLEVDFVEESKDAEADGYFTALRTDFPRLDFLTILHPKTPQTTGFWKVKSPELQDQLEKYALTITSESPDFSILNGIHGYLAEEQVFTVIAHHRACIKATNVLRVDASKVTSGEPDWFRDILF